MTRIQMRSDLQQLLYILYTRSLISSNFMFFLSLFLFLLNTTAGNRLSSLGEIMCGAFFEFDSIYAEKICRD